MPLSPLSFLLDETTEEKEIVPSDTVASYLVDLLSDGDPEAAKNIKRFGSDVMQIESSGGKNTKNKNSNARGNYQFMVTPKEMMEEGKLNSYEVGLRRLDRTYRAMGREDWDYEGALERLDPDAESNQLQEDVFFADLYQKGGPGVTNNLLRRMMKGDQEAAYELYSVHHHTDPGDEKTRARARKQFGLDEEKDKYKSGGLIRDAYGRSLF